MPARNVVLTEHQATLVEELASCGRCQNASEALRSAVQVGISNIESGRSKTFDSKESSRLHLQSLTAKAIAAA